MARDGVDLLLLTTEADIRWFSGFLTAFWQSPTRPWFLLVPAGGLPIAVIPTIGETCMARTWVRDIRTWSSPDLVDDGVGLLVETIREIAGRGVMSGNVGSVRIGVPMGAGTHVRMPLAELERLRAALPGGEWRDASPTLNALRAIKSEREIAKIRHVCLAASRAFAALPDIVAAGMRDIEAFRAFTIRCLEEGVDDVAYLVGAAGRGGGTTTSSRPLPDERSPRGTSSSSTPAACMTATSATSIATGRSVRWTQPLTTRTASPGRRPRPGSPRRGPACAATSCSPRWTVSWRRTRSTRAVAWAGRGTGSACS